MDKNVAMDVFGIFALIAAAFLFANHHWLLAILLVFIIHYFSTGTNKVRKEKQDIRDSEAESRELRFFHYYFCILAKLAKADGIVDAEEIRIVERIFEQYEFAKRHRTFCIDSFNRAKDGSLSIYWYAEHLGQKVTDPEICNFLYELLWDIACADGWLHPAEKEILQKICSYLRIPDAYYQINYRRRACTFKEGIKKTGGAKTAESSESKAKRWKRRRIYVSGISSILDAYEILECEHTVTNEELKSAYRKIAKRYHPDLLRANGVPDEMIVEATHRMAQVNAAWEDVCRTRGI